MAEGTEGEIDGIVSSNILASEAISSFDSKGYFLNYTRVYELNQDQYNLSPRK